jgi:hypothetical protein
MNQPAAGSLKAASAVAKAATLRDLHVVLEQLYQRDSWQNPHPLARDSRAAAQMAHAAKLGPEAKDQAVQPRGTRLSYPVFDVTKLPDTPDDSLALRQEYMNSPLCWMQLLPNHLEVNYNLVTGIYLWPPQEVFYPAFFDFDLIYRWAAAALPSAGQGSTASSRVPGSPSSAAPHAWPCPIAQGHAAPAQGQAAQARAQEAEAVMTAGGLGRVARVMGCMAGLTAQWVWVGGARGSVLG